MYAFGVLLNEMVGKEVPFSGMSVYEIRSAVAGGGRPSITLSCPKVLSDISKVCWDQDPVKRPSFEKLLSLLKEASNQV